MELNEENELIFWNYKVLKIWEMKRLKNDNSEDDGSEGMQMVLIETKYFYVTWKVLKSQPIAVM